MLKMSREALDWICQGISDPLNSPLGGRTSSYKRKVVVEIFWMLEDSAKSKDSPPLSGGKSTVHPWFKRWMEEGVFEQVVRSARSFLEKRDGYRL